MTKTKRSLWIPDEVYEKIRDAATTMSRIKRKDITITDIIVEGADELASDILSTYSSDADRRHA